MTVVAFIPARSGSKGVINKNLRLVDGKPLLTYTLKAALLSKVDKVILSSDSDEIHSVASEFSNLECSAFSWKLEHHKRSPELSSDTSLIFDVIYSYFKNFSFKSNEILILLQPTSPIRKISDINGTIECFSDATVNSVISACVVSQHPREIFYREGNLNFLLLENTNDQPRQLYKKMFFINGSIYAVRLIFYLEKKRFFDLNSFIYFMDTIRSIEIDTENDLFVAESLIKNLYKNYMYD